jgi:hypothetical protein
MELLIEDFSIKVGKGDIFKPTVGNESFCEKNIDDAVMTVNFVTSSHKYNIKYYVSRHVKWVPSHHGVGRLQVADGGDSLQIWRIAENVLYSSTA